MKAKVLLVDAFNLIRRIFEARQGFDHNAARDIDEVIQSSKMSLARGLKQHPCTHACVVFDSHDISWRHLLYSEYKGGRKPTPSALLDNIARFEACFTELGVPSLTIPGYEADDVIATLAVGVAAGGGGGGGGGETIILSTDKGFLPLLSDKIKVFNHFEQLELTLDTVYQKYDVPHGQLIDYWAMAGDASNNIKGVPKIGKKSAAELLKHYASLDDVLKDEEAKGAALKVQNHADLARLCYQLVSLKTDVPLGINLKSLRLDVHSSHSNGILSSTS